MATTTNYSWSTPDDTALVKDGAAAIRSLGTAIDTTVFTNAGAAINKSIVDAAGDLIYGTADNTVARLALGTASQVLRVNSGATAPEWATPASSGGITLISTTAMTSGSSITLSSIPQTYNYLYVTITSWRGSGNAELRLTFNGAASASDYTDLTDVGDSAFNDSYITLSPNQLSSATNSFMRLNFPNYSDSTSWKIVERTAVNNDTVVSGSARVRMGLVGIKDVTTAITSLVFTLSTGTFAAGTLNLYGVN